MVTVWQEFGQENGLFKQTKKPISYKAFSGTFDLTFSVSSVGVFGKLEKSIRRVSKEIVIHLELEIQIVNLLSRELAEISERIADFKLGQSWNV